MKSQMSKSKAVIKKEIVEFLNATSGQIDPEPGSNSCGIRHGNSLVLATCANNVPRATVLEFFNEGMTLYIFAEPGGKIANIRRNAKVSAVIYEQPLDHGKFQKSLQLFGTAELITIRNNPRLFKTKLKKWNIKQVAMKLFSPMLSEQGLSGKKAEEFMKRGLASLSIIKVVPNHVILKEWNPDFSMNRYEWKK